MRAVLALLLMAGAAAAQPVRLVVTAQTCSGLADKVSTAGTFVGDAKASVEIAEADFTASIMLDDGDGHRLGPRIIHATSCDDLAKSVAIVVSMALPAIADLPEPLPLPPSDAIKIVIEAVHLAPDRPNPVPQLSDAEIARRYQPEADASRNLALVATLGMSSTSSPSLALGVRWRHDAVSIGGEVAGTLPDEVVQSQVTIERASAALVPCRHVSELGICGVLRVGFDRGVGSGLMDARSVVVPLIQAGARVAWEHAVTTTLALEVQAELDVDATTSQFDVDNAAVWHSSRFAGLAGVGVVMRFP